MASYAKIINDLFRRNIVENTNFIHAFCLDAELASDDPEEFYLQRSQIVSINYTWDYDEKTNDSNPYSIKISLDLSNNRTLYIFTKTEEHLEPDEFLKYIQDIISLILNKPQINDNNIKTLYYTKTSNIDNIKEMP